MRERQKIPFAPRSFDYLRDGRQRNTLVGDANAYFISDLVDASDQSPGHALYLFAHALRRTFHGVGRTIAQGESERDSSYVQMLHLRHTNGLQDFRLSVF